MLGKLVKTYYIHLENEDACDQIDLVNKIIDHIQLENEVAIDYMHLEN